MVTADELRQIARSQGYRIEWSKRYQTRYAYACKGSKQNIDRRYLCGEHSLQDMKPEDIVKKLQ